MSSDFLMTFFKMSSRASCVPSSLERQSEA
jgi:hypothetical protein